MKTTMMLLYTYTLYSDVCIFTWGSCEIGTLLQILGKIESKNLGQAYSQKRFFT